MPIKLLVTSVGDDDPPDEYVFDQPVVSVGRDGANVLTLPDPVRVVSKQHAEVRATGSTFELVDLGSTNSTFLNGTRLAAGHPAALKAGDTFTIGDFEIRFYPQAAPALDSDRTVLFANVANPFVDPVARLASVLEELRRVFVSETGEFREEALREALRDVKLGGGDVPALLVAEVLRESAQATPSGRSMMPSAAAPHVHAASDETGDVTGQTARVLDTLAESVARLIGIPRQFSREFIGHTVTTPRDAAFLHEMDPSELLRLLLGADVRSGELDRRLGAIREATEEAVVHQAAMLDGYTASVQDGAQRLLGEVDPHAVEDEVEAGSPMYKVPPLRAAAVVERLKETHRELSGEDWSVAERRAFRPAFVNAYLARMSRPRP